MEYTKYLNLGFNIAIVVLHVTTIFFTFHVIYVSKFDKKSTKLDRISSMFFIFLASRGFGAILATPYNVYLAVYWSAEGGRNYEPYALLWLGVGVYVHSFMFTLSASLLTLERCLTLAFPMSYNSRIVKLFPWLTFICFTFSSIFVSFYILREIPLDIEKVRNCQLAPCVAIKYRMLLPQYAKFGICGLNILGSCYLMRAIKRNNSEKLKNDVVKFTITMDMFLDGIPIFANFVFTTIVGFSLTFYAGQLLSFLAFLNVAVCAVYYSWRLTRKTSGFWTKVSKPERVSQANSATIICNIQLQTIIMKLR